MLSQSYPTFAYRGSTTDTFTMFDGSEPDPDYVAERVAEVQNRVAYSAAILDWDYYRVVFGSE